MVSRGFWDHVAKARVLRVLLKNGVLAISAGACTQWHAWTPGCTHSGVEGVEGLGMVGMRLSLCQG
jgi:hypothetical protein